VNCGYCGREFAEDRSQKACAECPLGSSCGHVLCPYCGFENPSTPKWIAFLKDRFGKEGPPAPPQSPRPGSLPVVASGANADRRAG
jgi:hypothetical protein